MDYNKKLQDQIDDVPSFKENFKPISANELRIGNFINIGYDCKVVRIDEFGATLNTYKGVKEFIYYHQKNIRPIPLSEEILLKVGFEKKLGSIYEIKIDNGWKLNWESNYIFLNYSDIECEISHNKIIYLHQLQNLYFSLTNKELNTNILLSIN